MIKITITNKKDGRQWASIFNDQLSLDMWFNHQKGKEGRREQREIIASSETFNEADVISERLDDKGVRYVTLPSEFTYVIELDKSNFFHDIDSNTQKIISKGFKFKTKTFSLSDNAQKNWTDLRVLKDLLLWPVEISTKDNGTFLLERADLDNFLIEAITCKKSALDSGRQLKKQIKDADTLEKLLKIKDIRKGE